jgi:hypothetical protein
MTKPPAMQQLCVRGGTPVDSREAISCLCFRCAQEEDHAVKTAFYLPLLEALAACGRQSCVEPERGGGCHALRVPLAVRDHEGTAQRAPVRSALISLDNTAWVRISSDNFAHGWPVGSDGGNPR